jgi:predicted enzyme related to lactoylglutathione lyase
MTITNALASVAVNDLTRSMTWYQKLFGREADSRPMPEVAEWQFKGGGWLQVYQLKERAGAGSVTFAVSGLEDQIEQLRKIGIDSGKPMVSERVKVVMIKDPDGNSIAFAETLDSSMAR